MSDINYHFLGYNKCLACYIMLPFSWLPWIIPSLMYKYLLSYSWSGNNMYSCFLNSQVSISCLSLGICVSIWSHEVAFWLFAFVAYVEIGVSVFFGKLVCLNLEKHYAVQTYGKYTCLEDLLQLTAFFCCCLVIWPN